MSDSKDLIAHVVLPSTITDLKDRLESGRLSSIDNYICYSNTKRAELPEEVAPPQKSYKHEKFGKSFNLFSRNFRHKYRPSSFKTKLGSNQAYIHSVGKANILKNKVKCPDCGNVFINELRLPDDIDVKNDKNFQNIAKMNEQKPIVPKHSTNAAQFECRICDRVFLREENYANHLKCHSAVKHKHSCSVCYKGFSTKYDLIQHYTSHKVYVCSKCEKRFPDKWKLTRHLKTHGVHPQYKCTTCNAMFVKNSDLVKHVMIHNGEKASNMKIALPAPYASEAFEKEVQSRFENIVRFAVTGNQVEVKPLQPDTLHQCSICSKCFKDKWKLKRHMLTHANKNTSNEVKTLVLRTSNVVEHSEMQVHRVQEGVVCESAPKIAIEVAPVQNENLYMCCFCAKSFKDKSKLNRHVAIHTRDGSLNCSDAAISQLKSMILETPVLEGDVQEVPNQHLVPGSTNSSQSDSKSVEEVKLIQPCENLYKCTFCEKNYKDKWQLKRHLVIHTGEKSHVCNICNRKFYYKWRLVKHQKCHTAQEASSTPGPESKMEDAS